MFLNVCVTLLRPDALTGGVAQRGGCAAHPGVWPRLLRGLPQLHAAVRPANIFGDCQPPKLQAVRSSAEQAIEESPAVDDKYENMQLCDGGPGLAVQAAAGERGREAAGVPEVPGALHRQGRRRAHAACGLRHPRRLS